MNLFIIIGAKYLIFLIILLGAIFFFEQNKQTRKNLAIFGIISLPIIYGIAKLSALFYFDPRPFIVGHFIPLITHSADNGFPSDHVLLSSAIAMVIFYYNRKVGLGLLILAILVGICRVLAGIHHPIDILGSIVISIIVSSIIYYFLPTLRNKLSTKK